MRLRFLRGRNRLRARLRLLGALSLNWFSVLCRLLHRSRSRRILLRLGLSWLSLWCLFFSRFRGSSTTGLGRGQGFAYCGSTLTGSARIRDCIR